MPSTHPSVGLWKICVMRPRMVGPDTTMSASEATSGASTKRSPSLLSKSEPERMSAGVTNLTTLTVVPAYSRGAVAKNAAIAARIHNSWYDCLVAGQIGNEVCNEASSLLTTNCCLHRRTFQTTMVMASRSHCSNPFPHRYCPCSAQYGERHVRDCSARNGQDAHKRAGPRCGNVMICPDGAP